MVAYRQADKQSCPAVIPSFFSRSRGGICNACESYAWRDYPFVPSLYDVPAVLSRCNVRYDVVVSNDRAHAEEKLTVARVSDRPTFIDDPSEDGEARRRFLQRGNLARRRSDKKIQINLSRRSAP